MAERSATAHGAGRSSQGSVPPMVLPQHGLTRFLRVRLEEVSSLRLRRRALRPARLGAGLLLIALPFAFFPWWMALPIVLVGLG